VIDGDDVLSVLDEVAVGLRAVLDGLDDWGLAGTAKASQYFSDLAADEVALTILDRAGFGVLSEESGLTDAERELLVVLDPVDGSTNASRGIPWYAASLCAVDAEGPLAALVMNLATGTRFSAVRGAGAFMDGRAIRPNDQTELGRAVVGLSGYPSKHLGWRQYRAFGAAALDISSVAAGVIDAYIDCTPGLHGPWDYMAALLICQETGALLVDGNGDELVTVDWNARRMPVAAATPALLDEALAARRRVTSDVPPKNA
jgi:fructose-1,6-bisphosphatase/inositol monophosphatase family enzyme